MGVNCTKPHAADIVVTKQPINITTNYTSLSPSTLQKVFQKKSELDTGIDGFLYDKEEARIKSEQFLWETKVPLRHSMLMI